MNKAPDHPNLDALKARLDIASERLKAFTKGLDLPKAPTALYQQVVDSHLPPNLERLALFLFDNNGSRSDTISASVAIANISDTYTKQKAREQLSKLGLVITCEILPACNRYGALTVIGHLFIKPLPGNKLWQPRRAANDS